MGGRSHAYLHCNNKLQALHISLLCLNGCITDIYNYSFSTKINVADYIVLELIINILAVEAILLKLSFLSVQFLYCSFNFRPNIHQFNIIIAANP